MRPYQVSTRTVTSFLSPLPLYYHGIEAGEFKPKITERELYL